MLTSHHIPMQGGRLDGRRSSTAPQRVQGRGGRVITVIRAMAVVVATTATSAIVKMNDRTATSTGTFGTVVGRRLMETHERLVRSSRNGRSRRTVIAFQITSSTVMMLMLMERRIRGRKTARMSACGVGQGRWRGRRGGGRRRGGCFHVSIVVQRLGRNRNVVAHAVIVEVDVVAGFFLFL